MSDIMDLQKLDHNAFTYKKNCISQHSMCVLENHKARQWKGHGSVSNSKPHGRIEQRVNKVPIGSSINAVDLTSNPCFLQRSVKAFSSSSRSDWRRSARTYRSGNSTVLEILHGISIDSSSQIS